MTFAVWEALALEGGGGYLLPSSSSFSEVIIINCNISRIIIIGIFYHAGDRDGTELATKNSSYNFSSRTRGSDSFSFDYDEEDGDNFWI